jgi:hypothetical protein
MTKCAVLVLSFVIGCGGTASHLSNLDGGSAGAGGRAGASGAGGSGGVAPGVGGAVAGSGGVGGTAGVAGGASGAAGGRGGSGTAGEAGGNGAAGQGGMGGAASSAGANGSSGGAAGASSGVACQTSSDCSQRTEVCSANTNTCVVDCNPTCLPGTICLGGNICVSPGGANYQSVSYRTCVLSCNDSTSVCEGPGFGPWEMMGSTWTCTALCSTPAYHACQTGDHCAIVSFAPFDYSCMQDGTPGQPCGANGGCVDPTCATSGGLTCVVYGSCNNTTGICPTVDGADCAMDADCWSGTCAPREDGSLGCS